MKYKGEDYFIVDICGTIYRSNTTLDFIRYFWGRKIYVRILLSFPFRLFSRVICNLIHIEPLRLGLIMVLKGIPREQLLRMSEEFYNDFLKDRINKEVLSIIEKKREQGYQLILLSATLDVIAEVVSKKTNISQWLSSELAYSQNMRCLGKLKHDLLPNKYATLNKKLMAESFGGIITDNYTDAQLIEVSHKPFLVCYASSENRWKKILSKETIERCKFIKV